MWASHVTFDQFSVKFSLPKCELAISQNFPSCCLWEAFEGCRKLECDQRISKNLNAIERYQGIFSEIESEINLVSADWLELIGVWWRYRGCFLEWGFLLVRTVQLKRSTISKRSITETHLRLHWNWGKFIIPLDLRAHLTDLTWSKHLIRNKIQSKFSLQIVVTYVFKTPFRRPSCRL